MILTNNHNLPNYYLEAVKANVYDVDETDKSLISVTTLIGPPKIRTLKTKHYDELTEDIADRVWSIFGSAIHGVFELIPDTNSFVEERFTQECSELGHSIVRITGKPDRYDGTKEEIIDYKTTSAWTLTYNPEGKIEWERQLNIYRYLLIKAGYEVKALKVFYLLRDWTASKVTDGGNYPTASIGELSLRVWSDEEAEAYIKSRLDAHFNAAMMDCTDEDRWYSGTKYAVYEMKKDGKPKARASRVLDTEEAADEWANRAFINGSVTLIEKRPGEYKRCEKYCPVYRFCKQGGGMITEEEEDDNGNK